MNSEYKDEDGININQNKVIQQKKTIVNDDSKIVSLNIIM